ncbi:MAG TPA: MBOAT family O-acyltransferase [Kofleriaceae bacterium]|jgi:D-alanyl-lipoteichoic acid acyltransferase DltB (MBOAT superfamily)
MLFSSPDYPLFLIAVFVLYATSRFGGAVGRLARIALMVWLADLVFVLIAKDPDLVWDPIGNVSLRAVANYTSWPLGALAWHWLVGIGVLVAAVSVGIRRGGWLSTDRGQRVIARGLVASVAAIGAAVFVTWRTGTLDVLGDGFASYGQLLLLAITGIAIGAAQVDAYRPLGRVMILFVASCLFYQAWAIAMPGAYRYLLALLLGTIVLDFYLGLWIEAAESPLLRKLLVIVSLCSNLGILFFFKYTDFVSQDVLHLPVHRLNLILPAGISFHTFQSLSYTIDVYRKQLRATRSPIRFATFVLFFPQLVAGPIVRAQEFLPQLETLPALELERATLGLWRIVVGLFKKIALADTLAISIVDRVFEAPERFSSIEVLAGVYGYALQIYLDFSAYSDIAIGSADVLGIELPENFRTPYRSANLQEFWRRWHISLSTWLRDYLYISLGGNRGAPWRTYLNLWLTMLLGGLWHGASWTFVVWGALHGFGLAITRFFQRHTSRARSVLATCVAIAIAGVIALRFVDGPWRQLCVAWLTLTPLWAVATAWLGREDAAPARVPRRDRALVVELLRIAMVVAAAGFLVAIAAAPTWTWIPLACAPWLLGLAADALAGELPPAVTLIRRGVAVVLVFNYVCLAWIFFRATSFDNALTVLRQLALGETDHANLVPIVTTTLAVGFLCHFFADGGFRWARERFRALPPPAMGIVLAAAYFVLRELAHPKLIKFIYFQF